MFRPADLLSLRGEIQSDGLLVSTVASHVYQEDHFGDAGSLAFSVTVFGMK